MLCLIVLSVLALANGAVIEKRGLQTLDPASLGLFTQGFRQALLDKIAVEWNATVDMTKVLKTKTDACSVTIKSQTTQCKSCAKSKCQASPTFTDYLNLANPYTYLEGPMKDMASKFGDAADLLGDKASGFFTSMKDLAGSTTGAVGDGFMSAVHAINDGLNAVGDTLTDGFHSVIDTANLVGDGLTGAGHSIGDGLSSAAHEVEHIGSSIGHAIGSIFGKKREIDAQTRQCMEKCDSCHALLMTDNQKMVAAICGADIINLNNTINARVNKIQTVYNEALDKNHPIVTKLEFDQSSMNTKMELTKVYLTVKINGHEHRYQTGVPYAMMNMVDTARNMALEYYSKSH